MNEKKKGVTVSIEELEKRKREKKTNTKISCNHFSDFLAGFLHMYGLDKLH